MLPRELRTHLDLDSTFIFNHARMVQRVAPTARLPAPRLTLTGLRQKRTPPWIGLPAAASGRLDHDGSEQEENPLFEDPSLLEEMLYGMNGGGMMSGERPVDAPGKLHACASLLASLSVYVH